MRFCVSITPSRRLSVGRSPKYPGKTQYCAVKCRVENDTIEMISSGQSFVSLIFITFKQFSGQVSVFLFDPWSHCHDQ
jgi:hypothetical protein